MKSMVIGLFENGSRAQTVAQELLRAGFDQGDICTSSSASQFRDAIANTNLSRDEADFYTGEIGRGAVAVTAAASPDRAERAVQIMNNYRARMARSGASESGLRSESGRALRGEREMAFPVIEEELRIGKRMVERGGVRIFNRVTERPVEQQVNLREERIKVEHRHVDRPASEQDMNLFREGRQINLTEMSEEAVVAKEPHVIEEVIISKEMVEHPETIRDTVRRTEVEVERVPALESSRLSSRVEEPVLPRPVQQQRVEPAPSRVVVPNDLRQLRELESFEIVAGDIDPRGWELVGRDGEKIGKIDGLLVSPSARKAFFAVVNTGGWLQNKLFAIPIVDLAFDRSHKKAQAPYLKKQFHGAPEFNESDRNYQSYYDYWNNSVPEAMAGAAGSGRR